MNALPKSTEMLADFFIRTICYAYFYSLFTMKHEKWNESILSLWHSVLWILFWSEYCAIHRFHQNMRPKMKNEFGFTARDFDMFVCFFVSSFCCCMWEFSNFFRRTWKDLHHLEFNHWKPVLLLLLFLLFFNVERGISLDARECIEIFFENGRRKTVCGRNWGYRINRPGESA